MAMKPNYRGNLYRKTFVYQGKRHYVTATSEEAMLEKTYEKKRALKNGDIVINKNTTVEKWIEQWLEVDKKPTVKESTFNNIMSLVKNSILPNIGNQRLGDIKRINLQNLLNSKAGMSFSYLSKLKIYICEIFDVAERDELIDKNPSRFLKLPEYTKGAARAMTDEEYNTALKLCETHRAGLWIMVMLRCGLRRGETIPLVWTDINFDEKILHVNKSVQFVSGKPKLNDTPKTKHSIRDIRIPNDLMDKLVEEYKSVDRFLIFTSEQNVSMLTQTQITRLWNSFKRELDISLGAKLYRNKIIESKIAGLKLHSLRHTAITKLVESGADVKDVQMFAGHSDVQTTLNIYTHIKKDDAAERIVDIQNKSGTKSGTMHDKANK